MTSLPTVDPYTTYFQIGPVSCVLQYRLYRGMSVHGTAYVLLDTIPICFWGHRGATYFQGAAELQARLAQDLAYLKDSKDPAILTPLKEALHNYYVCQ